MVAENNANDTADFIERALLGCLLRSNAILADVVVQVREDDFRLDAHRRIYRVITDLWNESKPVDVVALADELHRRGHIADVGSYTYLAQLHDEAPYGEGLYYAKLVREQGMLRQLGAAGKVILESSQHPTGSAEQMVDAAEQMVFAIAQQGTVDEDRHVKQVIAEFYDHFDARTQAGDRRASGLSSGLAEMDNLTAGWQRGEVALVGARPATGKTAFALQLTQHAAVEEGVPTLFFSLEQSRLELAARLLCARAGVDAQRLRRGELTPDEIKRLAEAADILRQAPLFIDDSPSQRVLHIAARARRRKQRDGLGLVVIDYIQLIEPDNRRDPRHEQVGSISRRLKQLAKELDVPLLVLAQLNRSSEERTGHRPRLADLRESGSLEQDADTVLLLHRPDSPDPDERDNLEVIVAKQRNGPVGTVTLRFERALMRFSDFDPFPNA
jgi:replicative DNA helicase